MFYILALFVLASADLPVHCLYKQVLGDWTFQLDTNTFTANLHDEKTTCGHGQPDQVLSLPNPEYMYTFANSKTVTITLSDPNHAFSAEYGTGTWTMVYDEGFLIEFHTITFFNYFMYCDDETAHGKHLSVCDKTMKGWYRGPDPQVHENWGCFFGYKSYVPTEGAKEIKRTEAPGFKWVQPTTEFLEIPKLTSFIQTEQKYDEQTELLEMLNERATTWTAGINSNFKGMTMAQVNSNSGVKRTKEREIPTRPSFVQTSRIFTDSECDAFKSGSLFDLNKFQETRLEDIPTHCLPDEWDWTNINGESYVPPVAEQGDCGSCYIMSMLTMLSSRLQIQTMNAHKVELSPQFVVSCGFYTEGCEGGYPTLVAKFISEFNIVPESCMPFTQSDGQCSKVCNMDELKQVYSISDYYYVGGYYGASDEELMMKELRARGPIIGNFEPPMDFSYYKCGIYNKVAYRDESSTPSHENMRDAGLSWEKVDHSVLIVGYGEENGQKYWKVQNSWGTEWGENGFFRIKRGDDECSIESMGEGAVPYIINQ